MIPRSVLFGTPAVSQATLSPDGNRIAWLAPSEGTLNVWVGPADRSAPPRPVTADRGRGIHRYHWAGPSRILYLQDADGDENWRLFGVDLETGDRRDYTPYENVRVRIAAQLPAEPDRLIVSLNKRDRRLFDVYELHLGTGAISPIATNDGAVTAWFADRQLRVRAAAASTGEAGFELRVRDPDGGPWRRIAAWDADDAANSSVWGFGPGDEILLFDSRGRDTAALVALDPATGERRVLAGDPEVDVSGVFQHPGTLEPEAAVFVRERSEWRFLRPGPGEAFARIPAEGAEISVVSRDLEDSRWIVRVGRDDASPAVFLYEPGTGAFDALYRLLPELDAYPLSPMEPVRFEARDGLAIRGYLTFPRGAERSRLPMVLLVHGGPWARDRWGFDPQAQWLANRGYLCFQVNFRGSTGFGKQFLSAGDREWGGRMQDDLTDAVRWAVARGYADPDRIAIAGVSYGGYAALAGAAFTPDLYRCAVSAYGPSNLLTLLRSLPPYWSAQRHLLERRMGHLDRDQELLRDRSPLFHAGRIRIPILIAQGANDVRVPPAESEQIVGALRERGIPVDYLFFPDEGHGFVREANQLAYYAAVERFLARHLGGRYEPGGNAAAPPAPEAGTPADSP